MHQSVIHSATLFKHKIVLCKFYDSVQGLSWPQYHACLDERMPAQSVFSCLSSAPRLSSLALVAAFSISN